MSDKKKGDTEMAQKLKEAKAEAATIAETVEKASALATPEIVVPKRSEIPSKGMAINSPWGEVMIFGVELISPAILGMVLAILHEWDEFRLQEGKTPKHHGVHSIVFRDDNQPCNEEGKAIFGHALDTTGSMAINLEHIFQMSLEDSIDRSEGLASTSIYCNVWHHTMVTIMHEMHHLAATYDDPNTDLREDAEKKANAFAADFSYFLAQNIPMEPGPLAEEPFFSKQTMDTLQAFTGDEDLPESDRKFYKTQQMMALEGIMFWTTLEEGEERILKSFREFLHWTSDEEPDDAKWAKVYEKPAAVAPAGDVAGYHIHSKYRVEPPAAVLAGQVAAQPVPMATGTIEMNAYTGEETEVHEDPYEDAMMDMYTGDNPPWDTTPAVPVMAAPAGPMMGPPAASPSAAPMVGSPAVSIQPGPMVGPPVVAVAPQPVAAPVVEAPPALMPNSSGMAHGLSPAEVGECCLAVYRRLFNNLFTTCEQVNITSKTIRPDGQGAGCGGFNNVAAVQTPIPISDIPNAEKVFVQMDAKVSGKWSKGVAITGAVIGSDTGVKTMLPKYDLYIINHGGHMEKRTLLPQNPWKTHKKCTGCGKGNDPALTVCKYCSQSLATVEITFTKPAGEAQAGKRIMYIYSNNDMKLKVLAEQDASGQWREWLEDANWNVIG